MGQRKVARSKRRRTTHRRTAVLERRDDSGRAWTRTEVDVAVRGIVARLAHVPVARIRLATRFHDDLDWDQWFVLSVVTPIHRELNERLEDGVVLQLATVGDLARYVWARMEVVT